MPEITAPGHNPLQKYFRQPKNYIALPSKGNFYPQGSINMPESGELSIFAMTAKDELTFKTPDALINGQATVDVIKSCVPEIVDPWNMPSIDLDAVLVAIRLATYGEKMTISIKIPVINEEREYDVNLQEVLGQLLAAEFNNYILHNGMEIYVKPLSYKEFTKIALKTFEEQRVFSIINNTEMSDTEKLERFNESFRNLTNMTVNTVAHSIYKIVVDGNEVINPQYIQDFIDNADKEFYNIVVAHIESQREKFNIKPLTVATTEEEQKRGAPATFEVPITFDQSNFFA